MSVPHLPSELWIRIFTHLDPASLSSLSEVNHAFQRLATDQSLFRRRLLQVGSTHPAELYRRLEALHYPAKSHISGYSSARTELLCVVDDTLVLCDFERCRLISIPHGLSVDIEYLDSEETFLLSCPQYLNPEQRCVILPDGHLGFIHSLNPTYFAVLNVKTGELVTYPAYGASWPLKEVLDGKYVVAAGNDAQWIAYYTSENKIALVDWRSGELIRETSCIPDGVKYLMGECSVVIGGSLVGLVFEEAKGMKKEIYARGFDNVEKQFHIDEARDVHSVLRSANKKTYVMILSLDSYHPRLTRFVAYRSESNCEKHWRGFSSMGPFPELQENLILFRPRGGIISPQSTIIPAPEEIGNWMQHLWVEFEDGGSIKEEITRDPQYGTPVWFRRSIDGGFALIADVPASSVVLFKIVRDGQASRHIRLRRWHISNMIRVCVIADHYLIAQDRDGKIFVLHFNWFCDGAQGVYKCSGLSDDEEEHLSET